METIDRDTDPLHVTIFTIDHYLAPSCPQFGECEFPYIFGKVPYSNVIRIFGSTPTGDKICAHIHGFYPYFFFPFDLHPEDIGNETVKDIAVVSPYPK